MTKQTDCPNCGYPDTVEATKKFVAEKLREHLSGLVGAMGTDEARQKVEAAVHAVLKDFMAAGLLPTFEIRAELGKDDKTVVIGTFQEFFQKNINYPAESIQTLTAEEAARARPGYRSTELAYCYNPETSKMEVWVEATQTWEEKP